MAIGISTNWLKHFREKQHLSQEELAAALQNAGLDVARSTIATWESSGKSQAPIDDPAYRRALANIFQVSVTELLVMAGYEIDPDRFSETSRRAAEIVEQLPPEKQNLAVRLLEQLRE